MHQIDMYFLSAIKRIHPMTLYISDGKKVIGPLDAFEVLQYIQSQDLKPQDWQICDESHAWHPLADRLTDLKMAKQTTTSVRKILEVIEPGNIQNKPDINLKGYEDRLDLPGSLERIAKIRQAFDALWHKQRERLVSLVKNREPEDSMKISIKEHKVLQEQISNLVIDFWRKSGVILEWIKEITWGDPSELGDCYFRLKGADMDKKTEEAGQLLEEKGIHDWAGCYCFMKDEQYVYIGMTTDSLKDRITIGHKNKFFWDEINGIRILIPKNAKQCKKLERLLIMAYEPKVNDSDGHKSSAADDCLEIISKELEELTLP